MRIAPVSWHGAWLNQCASCLYLRCLKCHPTPTLTLQQVTSPWPSSSVSLALLSVGREKLAVPTLSFLVIPPRLVACSWKLTRGRLCRSTLKVRTLILTSPSPRCGWKRGYTWTHIRTGRGRQGLGCTGKSTWASREKHKEKGDVGIMSGHPELIFLPPWSLPLQIPKKAPCQCAPSASGKGSGSYTKLRIRTI
uniref:Uncharacterized protein n=1 Tax=Molossus molossus TaxID=27622 RepID=A0A7J8CZS4_MOLMO|nr:hypothetical protein HJG59_009489 [Molossus molossus]